MKKNIVNKIIAAAAFTALTLGGLTGCGNTEASAASSTKTANETSAATDSETSSEASDETNTEQLDVTKVTAASKGITAPYTIVDENNEITGSDIEILKAIFERLPQYELEIVKADDPLTGLTSGLYDVAVNNYAWRAERGELYYYSLPYKIGYDVYIQRIDDEPLTGLQDIADRGYKIEVGAGSNKALALEQWNEENPDHQIEIIYSESDFQIKFQNIVDGKTDVAIDDGPILDALIGEFGLENDLIGNSIDDVTQEFISPHNSSYFLFQKDDKAAALREDVDTVLKEIKEDGTLAEILIKYFGKDTSPSDEELEETLN